MRDEFLLTLDRSDIVVVPLYPEPSSFDVPVLYLLFPLGKVHSEDVVNILANTFVEVDKYEGRFVLVNLEMQTLAMVTRVQCVNKGAKSLFHVPMPSSHLDSVPYFGCAEVSTDLYLIIGWNKGYSSVTSSQGR